MGIYDRDYYREPPPGLSVRGPRTVVGVLVVINVLVYLADLIFWPEERMLSERLLSASNLTLTHPYLWWQFLTYGFAHAAWPAHIIFNMLQLWFLGRAVEQWYGRGEFLRVYLVMIVLGGVFWGLGDWVWSAAGGVHVQPGAPGAIHSRLLGASGAVCGVVMLFVLNFPHQTLILFPIPIPVKAWVVGLLLIGINLLGALFPAADEQTSQVAFGVHLTGIGFALLYFYNRWNLGRLTAFWPSGFGRLFGRGRSLGVVRPPEEDDGDDELAEQVDRILEKIQSQGTDSLTRRERRILQNASRVFQQRRRE